MIEMLGQTFCRDCGKPIALPEKRGPRLREFCNATCRQRWHRKQQQRGKRHDAVTMEAQARIAELERELAEARKLQKMWEDKYYGETRYHTDTRVRHFKFWLRKHPRPNDTDFFKRFLADRRINESASRSMYEARLRLNGYSEEDIALFHVAWRDMLFFDGG